MLTGTGLHAVPGFLVGSIRLAADVVTHTRCRHEVAFVGDIEKHFSEMRRAAQGGDRNQCRAVFFHTVAAVQPFIAIHGDLLFGDEALEDLFGHVGFENPHRAILATDRRAALALVAVLLARLPFPRIVILVMLPDAVVKLARQAADGRLVSGIGRSQPPTAQPAEMLIGSNNEHRTPHFFTCTAAMTVVEVPL